jgi:hypothetical protein
VQGRCPIGLLLHQARAENVRKEVMVAKPVASIVERNDEQVSSLQSLQQRVASLLAGDGIAQRTTQPLENGGLEQEAPDTFGLTLQDLFDQIVHDVPVVSSESPDEPSNVLSPPHRECRQLEPRDPALSAVFQCSDVFRREVQAHHPFEKLGGLGGGETQVRRTQFAQLAPGA